MTLTTRIYGRQVYSTDKGLTWIYRNNNGEIVTASSLFTAAEFIDLGV